MLHEIAPYKFTIDIDIDTKHVSWLRQNKYNHLFP